MLQRGDSGHAAKFSSRPRQGLLTSMHDESSPRSFLQCIGLYFHFALSTTHERPNYGLQYSQMTTLPTTNSQIATHLSDRALTPLVSSSQTTDPNSQAQAQALSALTSTAITAYDSAARLGLGLPQRILIESRGSGPVVLHSFLNPVHQLRPLQALSADNGRGIVEQAREELRPLSGSSAGGEGLDGGELVNGVDGKDGLEEDDEGAVQQPPLLIASVVVPNAGGAGEARRVAAGLERVGREFQREWVRELEEEVETVVAEDG